MLGGWNIPHATETETQEVINLVKVPTTTKLRITKIGSKFAYGVFICGGEWTEEYKFMKSDLFQFAKNTFEIQEVNRKI